jgi:hypothetical protein
MKIDGFVKTPLDRFTPAPQTDQFKSAADNMATMIEQYLSINIITVAHLFKDGQAALVQHSKLYRMH